tara:strand:+ start:1052 stop:1201 length:150 start_codon:yes stop_codon:yes gene_type:complete
MTTTGADELLPDLHPTDFRRIWSFLDAGLISMQDSALGHVIGGITPLSE